ncbi:MAG: transposase, partial [Gammaproteobacteria bacterium]|nr:transposase [Gammaproteobacteria bacterium]
MGKYPKLSERRACLILGVPRSTMRYQEVPQVDETALRHGVLEVANLYGRYGYRTVFDLLSAAGWQTTDSVVRRIWSEEGLQGPGPATAAGSGCGCMMDRACDCAPRRPTMSGAMTLFRGIPTVP